MYNIYYNNTRLLETKSGRYLFNDLEDAMPSVNALRSLTGVTVILVIDKTSNETLYDWNVVEGTKVGPSRFSEM
jgi:hypothetical protein